MNARERVTAALEHREPDRIPLDMWGSASRLNTDLYKGVCAKLGLNWEENARLIRPGKDTMYEDYVLADALGSDFRHLNTLGSSFQTYKDENGYEIDEWGLGRSLVGLYPTIVKHPLKGAGMEELEKYSTPDPDDPARFKGLGELACQYAEDTDKFVTGCSANSGQVFDVCQFLCGTEDFFVGMFEEEDFTRLLIKKVNDYLIRLNLNFLEEVGKYIGWLEFTSDFGTQHAPFISVEMFRDFFKEPYTELFSAVKKNYPHIRIFMHSCGSVADLIGEFIDCGADIINPIQPLAADMDSAALKERYGDRATFHGAIDIQHAMDGTLDDVRREVDIRLAALGKGGGYILSPANHLQRNVPPENVIELYRYAAERGRYPLQF